MGGWIFLRKSMRFGEVGWGFFKGLKMNGLKNRQLRLSEMTEEKARNEALTKFCPREITEEKRGTTFQRRLRPR